MSHTIRRAATIVAALALAVTPAACGGDDDAPAPAPGGDEPTATPASPGEDSGAGTGGGSDEGREIFASTCGSCHTLEAAGTSGTIGPNLDELQPDRETVLNAIETGPSQMPENLVQGTEAEAVADFVAQNAGS